MAFFARNAMLGAPQRYRDATTAERYYLGLQYEGRPDWEDKSVPLRKRRPAIQRGLYRDAIDTLSRFIWGGARFPKAVITATRGEDDDAEDATEIGPRLDYDQAEDLTRFLTALIRCGSLHRAMKEATRDALITTSCAVVIGIRAGWLTYHVEPGKHCTPMFGDVPGELDSLDIQYQYPKEVEEPAGSGFWKTRDYWYRRTIDRQRDVTYVEVPVIQGRQPQWTEDKARTVDHGLGFVPARWIRTLPDSSDPIDGRPVIDPQLYPLIEDVDRISSQRSRAIAYGCDPQLVRKGLKTEDQKAAIQKAPAAPWDLPPDGDAKFLEIIGSGAERASEHIDDFIRGFREAVSVVKADPKTTSGNISGVVLEFLHAPMIALTSDLRDDLGVDGFCGVLNLALRLVCAVVERGEDVWVQGADAAARLMRQAQLRGEWLPFPVEVKWEPFFPPTVQEQQVAVQATVSAQQGGLISRHTATRAVAPIFNIEDPDAEHEQIDAEEEEHADRDVGGLLERPQDDDAPDVEIEAEYAGPDEEQPARKPPQQPTPPRRRPGKP